MDQVAEFRQNADQCRRSAAQATNEILRAELLELAKQWSQLADEYECYGASSGELHSTGLH
jgi:hypothetical protein